MERLRTGHWTEKGQQGFDSEGREHGAAISLILEDMPKGRGPRLHRHPYGETWVVLGGEADFSDGVETVRAAIGDVVYVAAGEPHKFTSVGDTPLRMVCIHQSESFETVWLE